MKCAACGTELPANAEFCQHCGRPVHEAATHEPASVAQRAGLAPRQIADVPEEVLWEGGYSPRAMLGTWIAAAVASVGLLIFATLAQSSGNWLFALLAIAVLWIGLGLHLGYKRMAISYRLTNQRFFHERGILRRVTNRIEVIDVDDIELSQGLVERMVGVGRLKIVSSDETNRELVVDGIADVQKVFSLLDSARRAERLRRGVSVQSV